MGVTADDVSKLSREEKLRLLEMVWESLRAEQDLPVPEWERQLIEQRLAAFRSEGSTGRPWSEVMAELRKGSA
ncbi:MAG: addiction module protein [Planctomycetes bacterium]|nr:addiction module protein [Planctomycetota bacterium]MCW8135390.1 addiction module protein [Planctomycetota bacterium]